MAPQANNKGQTLLETVVALLAVVATISVVIITLHTSFIYLWLQYSAYEVAICLSERRSFFVCQIEGKTKAQRFLRTNDLIVFSEKQNKEVIQVSLHWVGVTKIVKEIERPENMVRHQTRAGSQLLDLSAH